MNNIYIGSYKSPFGELIIGDFKGQLCMLDWKYRAKRQQIDERISTFLQAKIIEAETELQSLVVQQIEEYASLKRTYFDIPIVLAGSAFQQRVWHYLMEIPFGKTMSYLTLSKKIGDEKAIRAVASANGANAISIIVPCHRIIGSNGELTGYAGGTSVKKKLLQLEGSFSQQELF